MNSLSDQDSISQFPSAMGTTATGKMDLAFEIARATAAQLSAVGVNMLLGPVLDVLAEDQSSPLGVRAASDDAQETSSYGIATMRGFQIEGVGTSAKHFPSYGSIDPLATSTDMPVITESLTQLRERAFVPFANAIDAGMCAVLVGGGAVMNSDVKTAHACLSKKVVGEWLRQNMKFSGVIMSECLEIDALGHEIGFRGATVMAIEAGCDMVLLCRSAQVQHDAISGLKAGLDGNVVSKQRVEASLRRVLDLKATCTSWEKALNSSGLRQLSPSHVAISRQAYDHSITVVRDRQNILPLSKSLLSHDSILLLTPLLKPVHKWATAADLNLSATGEDVFQNFGRLLASKHNSIGKTYHTSYTANGVRPVHESLIRKASLVIVVTADGFRNLYQVGFVKHIANILYLSQHKDEAMDKKSLLVIAVSSPYDFAQDESIGTYICTYDHTEPALISLARVLFGEIPAVGSLPRSLRQQTKRKEKLQWAPRKSRPAWLVEKWTQSESHHLDVLFKKVEATESSVIQGVLTAADFSRTTTRLNQQHYMVRNNTTKILYGFLATYWCLDNSTGYIAAIVVEPSKRTSSIAYSMYQRAMRHFHSEEVNLGEIHFGCHYPSAIFTGIPLSGLPTTDAGVNHWLAMNLTGRVTQICIIEMHRYISRNISTWLAAYSDENRHFINTNNNTHSHPAGEAVHRAFRQMDFDVMRQGMGEEDEECKQVEAFIGKHSRGAADVLELYRSVLMAPDERLNSTSEARRAAIWHCRRRTDDALLGILVVSFIYPVQDQSAGMAVCPIIALKGPTANALLQSLLVSAARYVQREFGVEVLHFDQVRMLQFRFCAHGL